MPERIKAIYGHGVQTATVQNSITKKNTKYRYFLFITHIITPNKAPLRTRGNDFLIVSSFLSARRICTQFKAVKHVSKTRVFFGACVTFRKLFAFIIKLYRPQLDNKHGWTIKFISWDTSNADYVISSSPVYFFF